ncbi:MAG: septum formation initiator family protein [Clostridia bacterium]|nr:septum formation initiator family protein [Clostridia bacterium]
MKKKLRINRFVIIGVLLYFLYVCITQQQSLNSYEREAENYKSEIADAQKENQKLQYIKNNVDSEEYIEEVAREKLGMYLPNERVYIDITN